MKESSHSKKSINEKRTFTLLVGFVSALLLEFLFALHFRIGGGYSKDGFYASLAVMGIESILVIIAELYFIVLTIYLIRNKLHYKIWISPFLCSLLMVLSLLSFMIVPTLGIIMIILWWAVKALSVIYVGFILYRFKKGNIAIA